MESSTAKRRDKAYWSSRLKYLTDRVRQIQEELRDSATSAKRKEALHKQLKSAQERVQNIRKEHGAFGENLMTLKAAKQYRKSLEKSSTHEDPSNPLNAGEPIERTLVQSASKKDSAETKAMNELLSLRESLRGSMRTHKARGNEAAYERARKKVLEINKKLKQYKGVNPNTVEDKKATTKPTPAKSVRKTTSEDNKSKWDKIEDIKKYAKQLTTVTDESKKTSLRNTIAELYGALTAAERKNIMLNVYVSKSDMKRMAAHDKAVEKLFNSPSTMFSSPAQIKLNFAKDKKVADKKVADKKVADKKTTKTDAPIKDNKSTAVRYTKPKLTKMVKELEEQQKRGRKDSAASKKRAEDIKRLKDMLTNFGKEQSSADQYRVSIIASTYNLEA